MGLNFRDELINYFSENKKYFNKQLLKETESKYGKKAIIFIHWFISFSFKILMKKRKLLNVQNSIRIS